MTADRRRIEALSAVGPHAASDPANADAPLRGRVLVDGAGPVAQLVVSHLLGHGVRALHGAWAAEAALLAAEDGADQVRSAARRRELSPVDPPAPATLDAVVIVDRSPVDPWRARPWVAGGIAHLPVEVHPDLVVVGPLVDPGSSSCLLCHDYTRHDQARLVTPARGGLTRMHPWGGEGPTLLSRAAWSRSGPAGRAAPSMVLLASALTAALVLDVLEGDLSMAGISTEVSAPVPELVHRHWPRHPRCGCRATGAHWRAPA